MQSDVITIYALNEAAVTIEFGSGIDESTLDSIYAFNQILNKYPFAGMETTVPAYTTLTVFFDPAIVTNCRVMPGTGCFEKVSGYLKQMNRQLHQEEAPERDLVTIPVCYGGEYGPDLEMVARIHGFSCEQVIGQHSAVLYTVSMIGFLPGFAYLAGLPTALETPRRETPRKLVNAGAVGIAGKQTGIYSLESPGGWQIIGRTPLKMFDARRASPALLKAGDRLRFIPLDFREFEAYQHGTAY